MLTEVDTRAASAWEMLTRAENRMPVGVAWDYVHDVCGNVEEALSALRVAAWQWLRMLPRPLATGTEDGFAATMILYQISHGDWMAAGAYRKALQDRAEALIIASLFNEESRLQGKEWCDWCDAAELAIVACRELEDAGRGNQAALTTEEVREYATDSSTEGALRGKQG